jgi:hypothetical protein
MPALAHAPWLCLLIALVASYSLISWNKYRNKITHRSFVSSKIVVWQLIYVSCGEAVRDNTARCRRTQRYLNAIRDDVSALTWCFTMTQHCGHGVLPRYLELPT